MPANHAADRNLQNNLQYMEEPDSLRNPSEFSKEGKL